MRKNNEPLVSVVMPCLNEEDSVGICVEKAVETLKKLGIKGEVIVSDNGSTDNSVKIAKSRGARVVHQPIKGYGSAYLKGFEAARGKYIVMGDSDNTYDFRDLKRFIEPLEKGYDMVMGSRLKGRIKPGAMPWLHKYIGNPLLSWFLRTLFNTKVSDAHCGMRSFTKDTYKRMHLKTKGMEFASEIVINAAKAKLKIKEIPITLHANNERRPHLNSLRDGWRHLRFMIEYSPFHLFFIPGIMILTLGIILFALLIVFFPLNIGRATLGPNTAVLSSLFVFIGFQLIISAYIAKLHYYKFSHFERPGGLLKKLDNFFSLEKGILAGLIPGLAGLIVLLSVTINWINNSFGPLSNLNAIASVFGMTLVVLGIQIISNSFLVSIIKND
ncbi:MAG: glycosyltransferase family 2 protein [Nanoarchaeota archaeon]